MSEQEHDARTSALVDPSIYPCIHRSIDRLFLRHLQPTTQPTQGSFEDDEDGDDVSSTHSSDYEDADDSVKAEAARVAALTSAAAAAASAAPATTVAASDVSSCLLRLVVVADRRKAICRQRKKENQDLHEKRLVGVNGAPDASRWSVGVDNVASRLALQHYV